MSLTRIIPRLDQILRLWHADLGADAEAYGNHCYRVFHLCHYLAGQEPEDEDKIAIAAAFHDLGIWTAHTFDYLEPSRQLARDYLTAHNLTAWAPDIEAMIENHHKFSRCRLSPLAEAFRQADWADVTLGLRDISLPAAVVAKTRSTFPNAGFHRLLLRLATRRLVSHPFSPLPMLRF